MNVAHFGKKKKKKIKASVYVSREILENVSRMQIEKNSAQKFNIAFSVRWLTEVSELQIRVTTRIFKNDFRDIVNEKNDSSNSKKKLDQDRNIFSLKYNVASRWNNEDRNKPRIMTSNGIIRLKVWLRNQSQKENQNLPFLRYRMSN